MANTKSNDYVSPLAIVAEPVYGIGPTIKGPSLNPGDLVIIKLWKDSKVTIGTGDAAKTKIVTTIAPTSRAQFLGATIGIGGEYLPKTPNYKCNNAAGVVTGQEPWCVGMWFKLEDGAEIRMPVLSTPGGSGGGSLHLAASGAGRQRVTFGAMLPADREIWAASMKALADAQKASKIGEEPVVESKAESVTALLLAHEPGLEETGVVHAKPEATPEPVVEQQPEATPEPVVEQVKEEPVKTESKAEKRARLKAEAETKRAAEQAEAETAVGEAG